MLGGNYYGARAYGKQSFDQYDSFGAVAVAGTGAVTVSGAIGVARAGALELTGTSAVVAGALIGTARVTGIVITGSADIEAGEYIPGFDRVVRVNLAN